MLMNLIIVALLFLYSCGKTSSYVYKNDLHAGQDTLKFCFVGDLGKDTPAQQDVANALFDEQCDEIYFLGDLVYPSGIKNVNDEELQKKFLNYYEPLFNTASEFRINLVLGNHDYSGNPDAWEDVVKKYPGYFFPNNFYLVDYGGLCILAVDTNYFVKLSLATKAAAMINWLTLQQLNLKNCKAKIAVSHHPFKGGSLPSAKGKWEGSKGALKSFLDTYIIGKMDMHIAGHVHALEDDGVDEGTRMLISGAGGETRNNASTPGFIIVKWSRSKPKDLIYKIKRTPKPNYTETELQNMEEEEP